MTLRPVGRCSPVLCALLFLACGGSGVPPATDGAHSRPVRDLPGAPAFPQELRERLAAALAAENPGGPPRASRLFEDGTPRYVNRLVLESSPYLRQHAYNPVNWYPWGDEAFATAERLGRPVLLSIGYSTCHWCHVMEEESFEDEEIAAYLNANYVAIKVDREERPDLDAVYMAAVQMLSGSGGWPMTVWLTPQRRPFFGGTYFPPRDGDRGARTGFLTLLRVLRQQYDERSDVVADRADRLTDAVRRALQPLPGTPGEPSDAVDVALGRYRAGFDERNGGLRGAPKFPGSLPVRLLLRHFARSRDELDLRMARLTLRRMATGGLRDQLGGGFHRYAVDEDWRIPHFEQMLYVNALMVSAYLDGYQATGDEDLARVAREVLQYVAREMTAPGGAFFSAIDADSSGADGELEEGRYFTWTPQEIREVLGADEAALIVRHFGVTESGDLEGRSVLRVARPLDEVARELGLAPGEARDRLEVAREALRNARARRPRPFRDDKILSAWNGLMISALARGGFVLDDAELVDRAERAADFVLGHLVDDGRLRRSYVDGEARHAAYLEDYTDLIAGLLDLYEATGNLRRLREAMALQRTLDEHYRDAAGGYFMTGDDHEELLTRSKPALDGETPTGNSTELMNLLRLHALTTDDVYRANAETLLGAFAGTLRKHPWRLPAMLEGLEFRRSAPKEIVVVAPANGDGKERFLSVLRRAYLPGTVRVLAVDSSALAEHAATVPPLTNKTARDGRTTAYICELGACRLPATDVETFRRQLGLDHAR